MRPLQLHVVGWFAAQSEMTDKPSTPRRLQLTALPTSPKAMSCSTPRRLHLSPQQTSQKSSESVTTSDSYRPSPSVLQLSASISTLSIQKKMPGLLSSLFTPLLTVRVCVNLGAAGGKSHITLACLPEKTVRWIKTKTTDTLRKRKLLQDPTVVFDQILAVRVSTVSESVGKPLVLCR